ncbi:monovalent cation/H+ antiporter subunit E [Salinibaculum rarum]|uniref:monovalent cation/H+ antiporter subunit E n=1 Tax=Salinibaculum rarum TaxID=3058903 RepID=UPI00265E2E63|nr:monovalent cation/H+ antiporter subunit E [Salinibaculum sp. KK48]
MSPASDDKILVPVGESATMRNTVGYVVREAMDRIDAEEAEVTIHFVYPVVWDKQDLEGDAGEDEETLLERVEAWVAEDAGIDDDESLPFEMKTAVIGADQYLFSPVDYAELLVEYADSNALGHIILDPEFQPGPSTPMLTPLVAELDRVESISYEEAPVQRSVRGRQLLGRSFSAINFLTVFGLSYLFYLVIGGFAGTFDYATGAVSAGIVAALLSNITLNGSLNPRRSVIVLARFLVYVPFLLWEITKANLEVAYIVLHPSLPINPSMERIEPSVPRGLPVTTLANSITLTPGTVTVDVREREFQVHALSDGAREGLYDGTLERAVRFVFFGRNGARIPTPRERGQDEEEEETT